LTARIAIYYYYARSRKMKKLVIALALAVLLFSCDNSGMEDTTEEEKYYTITYHSEGHTSGEVPVDTNRYPVKIRERPDGADIIEWERPENGYITVMDQGTLEKVIDGVSCRFQYWISYYNGVSEFAFPGNTFIVRRTMDFYAVWEGP
jgi:hypothetical protein